MPSLGGTLEVVITLLPLMRLRVSDSASVLDSVKNLVPSFIALVPSHSIYSPFFFGCLFYLSRAAHGCLEMKSPSYPHEPYLIPPAAIPFISFLFRSATFLSQLLPKISGCPLDSPSLHNSPTTGMRHTRQASDSSMKLDSTFVHGLAV
jgi:hypothetical protein